MTVKHTPGPWRVDDDSSDFDIYVVGRPVWGAKRYGVPGEWDVCTIEILDERPDETMANARLMAAAPELLEAAKSMVARWPTDQQNDGPLYDEAQALRSAIAKAEGRS